MRYIAFDVETPNRYNSRMSAIGITVIEDGAVAEEFFSLVDPEQPFDYFNTRLTGISEETVSGAPTFPGLWGRIRPMMESGLLVAHNASFDMGVLRSCLSSYEIEWKREVPAVCTVLMGRRLLPGEGHKLNELCDRYGIRLEHHHADSDSRACAEILLRYIEGGADPQRFVRTYSMLPRRGKGC